MNHPRHGRQTPAQDIIRELSDAAFSFPDRPDRPGSPRPDQPFREAYKPLVDELVATTIRSYQDLTKRNADRDNLRSSIRQFARDVGTIKELVLQSTANLRECITALNISVAIPHTIDIDQLIRSATQRLGLNTDERTAPRDDLAGAVLAKSSAIMQHTGTARSALERVIKGCTDMRLRGEGVLLSGRQLRNEISDLQRDIKDLVRRGSHVLDKRQAKLKKLTEQEAKIKEHESALISELTQEAETFVMVWRDACEKIGEAFQSTISSDERSATLNTAPLHGHEESTRSDYFMRLNLSIRASLVCNLLLVSLSEDGRSITPAKSIQTIERGFEKSDPAAAFNLCGEREKALKLIRALLQTVFPQEYSICRSAQIVQARWNAETPAGGQFDFAKRLIADCFDQIIREEGQSEAGALIFTFGVQSTPLPQFKNS